MEAADAASLAVHTQDLAKRYGKTVALSGLTMSVRRAEVFGFLGPNGAGKTTAVKLLVGLAHPSAGEAWVLGAPVGDLQTRRRLGYLPELFRYQGWMKAREVLGLHCELSGLARADWKAEIAGALELVGLSERADDKVEGFSKGMQQRLGLAVVDHGRGIATGTMAQILGQDGAVRVRVTGLPAGSRAGLGAFETLEDE